MKEHIRSSMMAKHHRPPLSPKSDELQLLILEIVINIGDTMRSVAELGMVVYTDVTQ